MLWAMPLSRPKPPQAGPKASLYKGIDPSDNCLQGQWADPCRCLNPWPSGRIDRLGVRNSPTQNSKEPYFCYEAGPTGYGLYRQVRALGHDCIVVAPSLVPKRPGERVKTNRRDAVTLARLLRAGDLTPVWVPDAVHEAVRDLVRARTAASEDLRRKRQQLLSFLLRHGRIYRGRKHWTKMHLHWLVQQKFDHPAQQIVFQDAVDAIEDAASRLRRLDQQVAEIVPSCSMAPVVEAYQAMRGVSFGVAVTFVAEIGDLRRFDNPRQLMAFLGLVPSERSTGEPVRRASFTLAGNKRARRLLIEGAWSYRYPARGHRHHTDRGCSGELGGSTAQSPPVEASSLGEGLMQ